MKVVIDGGETSKVISLGDVFVSGSTAYMLCKFRNEDCEYSVVCLSSPGLWNKYRTFEKAVLNLEDGIKSGRLKHYPVSQYELILKES